MACDIKNKWSEDSFLIFLLPAERAAGLLMKARSAGIIMFIIVKHYWFYFYLNGM